MTIPDAPHAMKAEAVLEAMEASAEGLDAQKAKSRLQTYGKNELEEKHTSKLQIWLRQFTSPLVFILLIAALLSYFVGDLQDTLVILAIVLINGVLSFYQEIKAESSIRALKQMTESRVTVLREGKSEELRSSDVVPGDIVVLDEGDIIPADVRLLESHHLHIDEALLTGESMPAQKESDAVLAEETLPYELKNIALSGTIVVKGSATGVVVKTGKASYLASIAEKAQERSPQSPLTKGVGVFARKYLFMIITILLAVGTVAIYQGREVLEILYFLIAELVAAVPEGLPLVITLVLAIGAMRLSRKKTLIRYLPAGETLGSATMIASDKTGTITQGRLKVHRTQSEDEERLKLVAALANASEAGNGDPVDTSLAEWLEGEYAQLRTQHAREKLFPFDPERRLMASVNMVEGKKTLMVKGAYEALKELALNRETLTRLDSVHDEMADEGLRVLAFGIGAYSGDEVASWQIELLGLVGFIDPPKEGVKEAVVSAKRAGIRLMMITGDNPLTAKTVAESVDIWGEGDGVLTGKEVAGLDDEALIASLHSATVLARVLPEHKYRVVKLLQKQGGIVAVTGDGANDVPALKAADLGIAMGSGTEAAKSVAKMVIVDNNLSIIVDAIREGRIIADNIRKAIYFLISTSMGEIIVISGAVVLGMPLPLYPIQILWINVLTDSALDKTFPFTKAEENVMHRPPKKPSEQLFDKAQALRSVYASATIGVSTLGLFAYMLGAGFSLEEAVSSVFTTIVITAWINGIQALKENEPFFKNIRRSLQVNPYVWIGILAGIILQLTALTVLSDLFHTVLPSLEAMGLIAVASAFVFAALELRKWAEYLLVKEADNA